MEDIIYDYWLSRLSGIGRVKREKLLGCFGDARTIYHVNKKQLEEIKGLSEADIGVILDKNYDSLQREWEKLQKKEINFVSINSKSYPKKLINIFSPPYGLFYKGRLPDEDKPSVAIVGARNASYYGVAIAKRFGKELSENGVQVISGLARGIDISGQRGTLSIAGGQTYAVLGCGIDICYPREHINDYMKIKECGGIISEYAPGTQPYPGNFPLRNRIISGLSDGVLVVEARASSGSLITAELGIEQGKDIFAIPGDINKPLSEGGNRLIKNGAALVSNVSDILDALGLFYDYNLTDKKKKNNLFLEKSEKIVYASLSLEPTHVSQIANTVKMNLQEVMDILVSFEVRKIAEMVGNNYYALRI